MLGWINQEWCNGVEHVAHIEERASAYQLFLGNLSKEKTHRYSFTEKGILKGVLDK